MRHGPTYVARCGALRRVGDASLWYELKGAVQEIPGRGGDFVEGVSSMRVCVIGGTGHISTSLVRCLLDQGHAVTSVTRGRSGPVPAGATWVRADRRDRAAFERLMRATAFDAALDMVCFTREDAASSVRAFPQVRHFVQCSTVCTYGIAHDWMPVTEDHPLRPITAYGRHKAEADAVFLEAYARQGFPVTIVKPSTTYGPRQGLLRQIAWDVSWIARIRRGKPLLICDDGGALHQHLHVEDAARGFAAIIGRAPCLGEVYHLVSPHALTWAEYHRTAMRVLGRQVDLVGVPLTELIARNVPGVEICREVFAHYGYYSTEKLSRDVPEFRPEVSLADGMRRVIDAMDQAGRLPAADREDWEDRLIAAWRQAQGRAGE